jgi:hypothetical protein
MDRKLGQEIRDTVYSIRNPRDLHWTVTIDHWEI